MLSFLIVICSVPLIVGLTGFLLVAFNVITTKNSVKYAVLMSMLFAATELWFAVHRRIDLGQGGFDLVILFFLLWFLTFFVFWLGMGFGLRKFSRTVHGQRHDFGDSSILSMQYEETRVADES